MFDHVHSPHAAYTVEDLYEIYTQFVENVNSPKYDSQGRELAGKVKMRLQSLAEFKYEISGLSSENITNRILFWQLPDPRDPKAFPKLDFTFDLDEGAK